MELEIKREYKDRVFKMLFSEKKNLLSLYNAINGTNYTDEDAVEVNTLEDVIYMNMRNDLSFLLGCELNLYEQQSTVNRNMPLRGFMYCASLYGKMVGDKIHNRGLVKIPTPQMIVFYNGEENAPEREILKLSDAFMKPTSEGTPIEFTALALNINSGNNEQLVKSCEALSGYVMLVTKVREFSVTETGEKAEIEAAVNKAVDWCIKNDCIAEFLRKHKREVIDMLLTEYDESKVFENWRAEAYEEGFGEGITEGRAEGITEAVRKLLKSGMSITGIASALEMPLEEVEKIAAELDAL